MKTNWKRPASAALAAVMTLSLVPLSGTVRAAEPVQPTAHYDMSHSGNQLLDVSGNDNHATLYNTVDGNFSTYGDTNVLHFANKQYATLPQGLVSETDNDCAVEITLSVDGGNSAQWAWVIGDGVGNWGDGRIGNYLFVGPKSNQGSYAGKTLTGIKVGNEAAGGEKRSSVPNVGWSDGYHTLTVVSEDQTVTTYLDGVAISTIDHDYNLADVIPDGDVLGYIGKSLYAPDPMLTADVVDMKVYDEALTQEQVQASMPGVEVLADLMMDDIMAEVLSGNPSADQVTRDLYFPTTVGSATLTWGESSNPDVVDADGVVTPSVDGDVTVTIPVTITIHGESVEKTITVTVLAGEPGSNEGELVAAYDMTHEGNTLVDVSGNGNDATLYDTQDGDFVTYGDQTVWQLDGAGYATLPSSITEAIGDSENFTMQATVTTQTNAAHWLLTIGDGFGNWNDKNVGDYIFVNPCESNGNFLAAIKTGTGSAWKETRLPVVDSGMGHVEGFGTVTLVGRGGTLSLYLDGERVSTVTQDKTIQDVLPEGDVMGYIGKSLYTLDSLLKANISDVKVWSYALSKSEIEASLPTGEDKADMVMADLYDVVKGDNASLDTVTDDLTFPTKLDNVTLTWGTWDNTDVIAADGTVHAVVGQETKVTIPVSFQVDSESYTVELKVTVMPLDVDQELTEALESIDIPNKDDVRGNITLPETTSNGLDITWTTDRADIVNVNPIPATVEGYDDTPAGTVTRPESDTVVTVTAQVTLADQTVTKDIALTVKAAPEPISEEDYTDYFFTYFAGEGYSDGEQIYFAASQDGLNWTDLNENKPVLTSDKGEKGVRDPFIIRSPEGDKFYLIATDLKINGGNGWGAAQTAGSQALMVWESTDLVNWSDMRMVTVSAGIDAGCTWAPEATYDPLTGEYVVYWASKVEEDGYAKQRLYYAKTRDFYTFTEPQVFIEMDESSIDTTIIYSVEDGKYYRYTKNEGGATNDYGAKTKTVYVEVADTLLGEWTHIPSDSLNANQWVEGPTIFQFNQDDQDNGAYCLLVDQFGGIGYYPLVTDDLTTGEFAQPDTAFKMPSRARHGTPIRITSEEYARLMQQYGGQTVDNSSLQAAVDAQVEANLQASDYTQDSWERYDAALTNAQAILDKGTSATAAEVSAAQAELEAAAMALVPANRAALEQLVEECAALTNDGYTQESWDAFQAALTSAQTLLLNSAATPADLAAATDALEQAKAALEKEEQPGQADKFLLEYAYNYALEQDTSNLIPTVAAKFEAAMENAKAVLDDPAATQAQVDAAFDQLVEAIHMLDFTRGDKTMLELLITRADGMVENEDKYMPDNWQLLVDALAKAKDVYADEDAMDGEIQPVVDELLNAILAQRFKADKSILEDLIHQYQDTDLEGYTAESVAAFRSALAAAQAVMSDETLSEEDQATVDAAAEALKTAYQGLTAENPQPSETPEVSQKPEATDKPQTTEKPERVPQTGDNAQLMGYVVALAAAVCLLAGATVAVRRRRS